MANMEPIKVNHWDVYIKDHPTFIGCLIDKYNDKAWVKNGKWHREDGPAIECASGYKAWYQNGKRHREDGPACEWSDGDKAWCLKGVKYNEQEWLIAVRRLKLEEY